ncbi:MAG TPA: hypothetical protein PKE45_13140, partial [Caldilineaceae bacterium]|nr:hypothetical protein [Caldilineaceae bacterium]
LLVQEFDIRRRDLFRRTMQRVEPVELGALDGAMRFECAPAGQGNEQALLLCRKPSHRRHLPIA